MLYGKKGIYLLVIKLFKLVLVFIVVVLSVVVFYYVIDVFFFELEIEEYF